MPCAGGGRDGRGGLDGRRGNNESCCKRHNDVEAGSSSLRPLVEEWRTRFRSAGARAWRNFNRLDRIFSPTLKRRWKAEKVWFEAKEAANAGDEAAATQVEALFEEYQFAQVLSNTLMEYHLHGNPPRDDGDDE